MTNRNLTYSIPWNLFLLASGSALFSIGIQALAVPHGLIHGGLFGASMLAHYVWNDIPPAPLFFLLNIPLFILGWLTVSRRFLLYSLFAMTVSTLTWQYFTFSFHIESQLYAAIACGVICGCGSGVVLRSLGSGGGLDIVAVLLNRTYNLGIGKFYFIFNGLLFTTSFFRLKPDLVIASLIMVFVTAVVMEYVLALFSQRKIVFVVSDKTRDIARRVSSSLRLGSTFLNGEGVYSGQDKKILMTVIDNIQLKRLEELVFTEDPAALFIVENTFNVIGSSFSRRKIY